MKQKTMHIGVYQLTLLIITVIISTADIMLPSIVARISGRDSWISVILAGITSLLIMLFLLFLMRSFPSKGLFEIIKYVFGNWIGSLFCFFYGLLFIFYTSIVVRQIADVMYTIFIPGQSIAFFVIYTMVIVAISVYFDIECISRVNELFIPLGILALVGVIGLSIKRMDFNNFLPILGSSFRPVINGSVTLLFWLMESSIIIFMIPFINKPKFALLSSVATIIVVTSALLMGVLIIAVFGAEYTTKLIYSPVNLLAYVRVGKFYDTLDIFIMLIWVGGVLIKSSVLVYIALQSFSAAAGTQKKEILIIPVVILSAVFAITEFKNPIQLSDFLSYNIPVMGIFVIIIMPIFIVITGILKKRFS